VLSKHTGEQIEWKGRTAERGELVNVDEVLKRLAVTAS
jgi:hypothetical protein